VISIRIALEQRDAERKKREWVEDEKAMSLAKKRLKLEATQVSLGEREEVSRDLIAAQMLGYRNELLKGQKGATTSTTSTSIMGTQFPRVREPPGGVVQHERSMDRELYRRRQAAGGGIRSGSTEYFERNWNSAVTSLFAHI
jgi:hypothetical protein